jgi:endonuclease/exonuclease/phosphatase family metal-dependent hydrolase
MRRLFTIAAYGILLLFFLQATTSLVESIYILELLNTSLDEKALGVLFFFSPLLLLLFNHRTPGWLVWLAFFALAFGRGVLPFMDTTGSMLMAGVSTAASLVLLPVVLVGTGHDSSQLRWLDLAKGLALAVLASIFLRTANFTLDISLSPEFAWIAWLLAVVFGVWLWTTDRSTVFEHTKTSEGSTSNARLTGAGIGLMAVLVLVYFVFASPGVMARWTEANYRGIVITTSFLTMGWLALTLLRPGLFDKLSGWLLLIWNLIFTAALAGTILAHRVSFPVTPESPAMVVHAPLWQQQIPLVVLLLTFPVIYIDFALFARVLAGGTHSLRRSAPGYILGALLLVMLVFMNIFSNVWGYVKPVSPYFRGQFWLSFTLAAGVVTLFALWLGGKVKFSGPVKAERSAIRGLLGLSGILFIGTLIGAMLTDRTPPISPPSTELVVMTYNIQQANDNLGQKAYERQLALIRQVDPDILGMQESDSARISLGNNDYVRYYANKLGYYAYFGPSTVTGTYGTALLSKYPLENTRTIFTFSDQDEIGTTVAEIVIGDRRFTIYNVHPDGSDTAMLVFARDLAARVRGESNVIALGDYNLRMWEEPFQVILDEMMNAWLEANPGQDQERWIDHIFFSQDLMVGEVVYLLPPESATDHPAHWVAITWLP